MCHYCSPQIWPSHPDIPRPRLDSLRVCRVEIMIDPGQPPPLHLSLHPACSARMQGACCCCVGFPETPRNTTTHPNHFATHMQSENAADSVDGSRPTVRQTRRPRAARACDLCRVKKNKCNEEIPCSYCRSQSLMLIVFHISLCQLTCCRP